MNMKDFEFDLEHRVQRIEEKEDVARHESTVSPWAGISIGRTDGWKLKYGTTQLAWGQPSPMEKIHIQERAVGTTKSQIQQRIRLHQLHSDRLFTERLPDACFCLLDGF
jgi:hypothetical protein